MSNVIKPSVYGVGIVGTKYPTSKNGKIMKEYKIWAGMIERCFCKRNYHRWETYKDKECCEEWLYYENFYEWLHSQENFDKWLNGSKWCLDKDILSKGNKIYSPDTCCLVPSYVNTLFIKGDKMRGQFPIGVVRRRNKYSASISINHNSKYLGIYSTPEEAFQVYKNEKESHIKQVAQEEYEKGNIIKKCYDAMMKYEVEITD